MYGIVAAWEQRALELAPHWLQPMVAARRRTHLLELDLAWFGVRKLDHRRPELPGINDLTSLLGAMYVMEGSTLGGQLIARTIEKTLALNQGQGNAYFRGHMDRTGPMWKDFCFLLTSRVPDEETDKVVQAANSMFETYGEWMRENRS
jgi:heme oxygenase